MSSNFLSKSHIAITQIPYNTHHAIPRLPSPLAVVRHMAASAGGRLIAAACEPCCAVPHQACSRTPRQQANLLDLGQATFSYSKLQPPTYTLASSFFPTQTQTDTMTGAKYQEVYKKVSAMGEKLKAAGKTGPSNEEQLQVCFLFLTLFLYGRPVFALAHIVGKGVACVHASRQR